MPGNYFFLFIFPQIKCLIDIALKLIAPSGYMNRHYKNKYYNHKGLHFL